MEEGLKRYSAADVPVTAQCPAFQDTGELLFAPFLQRGCNRSKGLSDSHLLEASDGRFLVGVSSDGRPAYAHSHPKQSDDIDDSVNIQFFNQHISIRIIGESKNTSLFVPFTTMFDAKRLKDLKQAVVGHYLELKDADINVEQEIQREELAIKAIWNEGISPGIPNPLNEIVAFRNHDSTSSRCGRHLLLQSQPRYHEGHKGPSVKYSYFQFPAFALTGERFTASVWEAADIFQEENPTTFISRVQIIYAVLTYYWIIENSHLRIEGSRSSARLFSTPKVDLCVFIAYFPTWLRFHEIFRLGAYAHPFDFIDQQYSSDCSTDNRYCVGYPSQVKWEKRFSQLKSHLKPFAFLCPAMQEGSALGGPFLPTEWNLSQIHHLMGLGSIQTIGLPFMPSKAEHCHRLYAYPEHWNTEIPDVGRSLEHCNASSSPSAKTIFSFPKDPPKSWPISHSMKSYYVHGQMEMKPTNANPGWTSHLPRRAGVLCRKHSQHRVSDFTLSKNELGIALQDSTKSTAIVSRAQEQMGSGFLNSSNTMLLSFGGPITLQEVQLTDRLNWRSSIIQLDFFKPRERRRRSQTVNETLEPDSSLPTKVATSSKSSQLNESLYLRKDNITLLKQNEALQHQANILAQRIKISEYEIARVEREREQGQLKLAGILQEVNTQEGARADYLQVESYKTQLDANSSLIQQLESDKICLTNENLDLKARLQFYASAERSSNISNEAQVSETTRQTLKRESENALYYPGLEKKMRPSPDISLRLGGRSTDEIPTFLQIFHNEILRKAARGGLISPAHFEVGKDGHVGLTRLGIKEAESFEVEISKPQLMASFKHQQAVKATAKIRDVFHAGGFFEQGHVSLIPLKDMLQDYHRVVTTGDLLEDISDICTETKEGLLNLDSLIQKLQGDHREAMRQETTRMDEAIVVLYGKYGTRELPLATKLKLMSHASDITGFELINELKRIRGFYRDLMKARDKIRTLSQAPIPEGYTNPNSVYLD